MLVRAFALTLVCLAAHGPARAQTPQGQRLDLVRGPLITSSRILGLGGAFVGVAEGIDGIYRNPAALSNRNDRSTSFFDIDVTFDWLFVSSADIDWDGDSRPLSETFEFRAVNLGLVLQFGPLGLGVLATLYGWEDPGAFGDDAGAGGRPSYSIAHADLLLGAGWAFADGALIVGAGAGVSILGVTIGDGGASPDQRESIELSGQGGDFGVLWRPPEESWRLGARVRTQTRLTDPTSTLVDSAAVPWQVALGGSTFYATDPARSYNPALRSKVKKPTDRRYLLISAELVLSGPTDGYAFESIVGGTLRPSGRNPSLGVHLGAEGEVMHDRLKARVGTYFEPVRVRGSQDLRPHITGGLELHLFELLFDWKANFAFDVAPGWENVTIGVGFWK